MHPEDQVTDSAALASPGMPSGVGRYADLSSWLAVDVDTEQSDLSACTATGQPRSY